ncbi:M20 metallopeptidase family protein [Acidaminobacterium chupaoyuni]
MSIYQEAKSIENEIIAWRRYFHQHAEVGQNLPVTAAKVKEELEKMGVEYREIIPNAIMATIGKKGGRSILLRGDMDALPMSEQTGLPFASQNPGAMHSCGHDTHTAMLLGAAKLLKAHEDQLEGLAILMFQSDEEGLTGARDMIAAGALENPHPDRAVAIHISADAVKTGQILIKSGVCMASSDGFRITLHGKGGHGAAPEEAINPIFAAVKIIGAFEDIARYEIDPQSPSVVNICALNAGTTYNIIPNDCVIMGTVRMFDEEKRAILLGRLQQAMHSIAELYRCRAEWYIGQTAPSTRSDEQAAEATAASLKGCLPEAEVLPVSTEKAMGSEDFSFVTQKVPSVMISLGSTSPEGKSFPMHHPCVLFDENAFAYGTAAYTCIAMDYLR